MVLPWAEPTCSIIYFSPECSQEGLKCWISFPRAVETRRLTTQRLTLSVPKAGRVKSGNQQGVLTHPWLPAVVLNPGCFCFSCVTGLCLCANMAAFSSWNKDDPFGIRVHPTPHLNSVPFAKTLFPNEVTPPSAGGEGFNSFLGDTIQLTTVPIKDIQLLKHTLQETLNANLVFLVFRDFSELAENL